MPSEYSQLFFGLAGDDTSINELLNGQWDFNGLSAQKEADSIKDSDGPEVADILKANDKFESYKNAEYIIIGKGFS
jgi:hypothetical protein